jgi:hypothetical protein
VNVDSLSGHLSRSRYGDFTLTDAVRPAAGLPVRPRQGYRTGVFRDRAFGLRTPMLAAAASAEILFDTFLALLDPLGDEVHAVFESSHGAATDRHQDYRRSHIDRPVLASHLCEFEDLLLNDGCTGVAVVSAAGPVEVQFDEHKLLFVYAPNLRPFQRVLKRMGVRRRAVLPLLSEGEHLHHSTADHADRFEQLCLRAGVGDFDRVFSDESF